MAKRYYVSQIISGSLLLFRVMDRKGSDIYPAYASVERTKATAEAKRLNAQEAACPGGYNRRLK